MPGVGKSTLGKKLAAILNWEFVDLDNLIVKETRKEITTIFEVDGEAYFREIEEKTLKLKLPFGNIIVACGGGTPLYHNNLIWMKNKGLVIYLEASSNFIFSRVNQPDSNRPLFKSLNEKELLIKIESLMQSRLSTYEQANVKIKLPFKSIEPLIELVKNSLNKYPINRE
jgi:shikimate kinase